MRGLSQMFISLFLYNNNCFIDGKMVEKAHQIGKKSQVSHNNFKQEYKLLVSKMCARRLALIYLINGGKWGDKMQYQIGSKIQNLTHPLKPMKQHPLLAKWLIPTCSQSSPKIEVTDRFGDNAFTAQEWYEMMHDESSAQLIRLIQRQSECANVTIDTILNSNLWDIRRIKSLRFHQGTSSFNICFDTRNKKNNLARLCIVKLKNKYIIKFTQAFEIIDPNAQCMWLCKGEYYPIHDSLNLDTWVDDCYSSMDYIDVKEQKSGWAWMTNIVEPVLLLHNCVGFKQVYNQLPELVHDINAYDYVQNIIVWSNKLQRWKATHDQNDNVDLPCGPYYQCKRHKRMICASCVINNNKYSNKVWKLKL